LRCRLWLRSAVSVYTSTQSESSTCFSFNDLAPTEIYALSLHDALPIYAWERAHPGRAVAARLDRPPCRTGCVPPLLRAAAGLRRDRKSTRLNSSHVAISYAVFCLKKKRKRATLSVVLAELFDSTCSVLF